MNVFVITKKDEVTFETSIMTIAFVNEKKADDYVKKLNKDYDGDYRFSYDRVRICDFKDIRQVVNDKRF